MDIAVHRVVNWCDVLGITRDWGVCHDWIGIWRFINGFKLQPLMMNPKVRRFDILRIPFVFMGSIHRLAGSSLPLKAINRSGGGVEGGTFMNSQVDRKLPSIFTSSSLPNNGTAVHVNQHYLFGTLYYSVIKNANKYLFRRFLSHLLASMRPQQQLR